MAIYHYIVCKKLQDVAILHTSPCPKISGTPTDKLV